ncbi:MAG: hypothetical protein HYR64_07515 [Fimbriimonas ginsengisoli]|uniref:Uncharacterized protein n=1 Tax=Fimbriimonas ginsengisoli TaxID=1005039 RepID=A0A931LWG3_FIMGI|nr:hypothetical protein [Fimbriimonas ginsengisoli]
MNAKIYAVFRGCDCAEDALLALQGEGIAPDDLSLLRKERATGLLGPLELDPAPVERTAPARSAAGSSLPRAEREGSDLFESHIGGGISTSSPDDDVSAVEEMDDAPEIAEDQLAPANGRSYGSEDVLDAAEFASSGYLHALRPGKAPFVREADSQITRLHAGSLHIEGDGPLSTAATTWAAERSPLPIEERLHLRLESEGIRLTDADSIVQAFRTAHPLLCIEVSLPELTAPARRALEEFGALAIWETP